MCNYARTCKGRCSYNLVHNFLIQFSPLQSSVFAAHFSNRFWYGNEAFPKVSSQNEIAFLLVIFHLSYKQLIQDCENMFSLVCPLQNEIFSLVSFVQLLSNSCRSCSTRIALVSLVSGTHVVKQTRSDVCVEHLVLLSIKLGGEIIPSSVGINQEQQP